MHVIVDYAHNPEGLRGLLECRGARCGGRGRLGLLLGHAGNREDADIERLAAAAAEFRPDLVVVKELEGYLRGREPGEVPRILRAALLRAGLPDDALPQRSTRSRRRDARSTGRVPATCWCCRCTGSTRGTRCCRC